MPRNLDVPNINRRRFLAVAGSVAAASSLAVGQNVDPPQSSPLTATPVHYVVTIDVASGSVIYSVSPPTVDPHNMCVTDVDEIKWKVISAGPSPRHLVAIQFLITTPFVGAHGHPVSSFQWSEKDDATAVGFGGGLAQTIGTHEYCVAVYDEVAHKLYLDDPKIIVGTGHLDVKRKVIEAERGVREAREKLESIENILTNVIQKME
jgi:hypothetical protein